MNAATWRSEVVRPPSAAAAVIGVDIGGTFVKAGVIRDRSVLLEEKWETVRSGSEGMERALVESVRRLARLYGRPVRGVGIGVPGLVDYPSGVVRSCANLKGWTRVPLKNRLTRRLRLPVAVGNDVQAMTLAEWKYGAGRGTRNLVCMTLGTGVGGGLILNGVLYRGRGGPAGEIGHLWVQRNGIACPCGGQGCLERYVGNQDILRHVRKQLREGVRSRLRALTLGNPERLTPELIDRACEQGDVFARRVWAEAGEQIGLVLANVINLLNPERIVIGGGLALAGCWIFDPMRRTVRKRTMRGLAAVPIVPARLGPRAGMIGASLFLGESA